VPKALSTNQKRKKLGRQHMNKPQEEETWASNHEKQQLIDDVMQYAQEHFGFGTVDRKILQSKNINELQEIFSDAMLQVTAEAEAKKTVAWLELQESRKPQFEQQQKEQTDRDRKTFADAARTLRSFSQIEANFNILRQTLGFGFTVFGVQQAMAAGTVQLSPVTQHELNQWERERIEARNEYLKNTDPETLRMEAKKEAEVNRAAAQQAHTAGQLQVGLQREQAAGFPPLPETNSAGEILNGAFFHRLSNTDIGKFKDFIRKYGAAQVTEAIRNRK
jgi:vacuolar-type H+-ATPase subunit I/STV1